MMNNTQKQIRLGIIGIGNQGGNYLVSFHDGKLPHCHITAVADIDPSKFERAKSLIPDVACFNTAQELIDSGLCDSVVIATPHYFHPVYAIAAMKAGLHALSEKPAGVYTKQVREAIEFADTTDCTYAMMFNQRTRGCYIKMKELLSSGAYGEIMRVNWVITDWYRTQSYYDSGSWRATWAGEGGGVMLNQCPHQLDLLQWLCGMPSRVRAFCHVGQWHDIEVEDDVTIYMEYPNGATGTFITTTGEWPGTNRLEISLTKGKIVCATDPVTRKLTISVCTLDHALDTFTKQAPGGFDKPKYEWQTIEIPVVPEGHEAVLEAFALHILEGTPLVAEGREGINGLSISNAAFLSSWLDKSVDLPPDEDLFYTLLQEKIKNSKYVKNVREQVQTDMSGTF